MLMCGVGAKAVAQLMKFHLLQWEVVKVKFLMNSNMTLTVLHLHQKTDQKVQQHFKGQGHYDFTKGLKSRFSLKFKNLVLNFVNRMLSLWFKT